MPDGHSPLFPLTTREPPANIMAEQALLGALLRNNRALDLVAEFLLAEHFADPINGRIYQEISRLISAGRLADAVTLRGVFQGAGILDEVGGTAYLGQLLTAMVGIINAGEYGRSIHDAWLRRQLIDVGETVVNSAFGADPALDGQAIVTETAERVLALGEATVRSGGGRIGAAAARAIEAADSAWRGDAKAQPLTCGLPTLDEMWGGLWPGEQYYVVARSRTGKTPFMMQVARHVAAQLRDRGQGEHVLVCSLEMPAEGIATGSLAALTGIAADDIRRGRLQGDRPSRLIRAQQELDTLPIHIEDQAGMTLGQLVMRARSLARQKKVRLVTIDHRDLVERDKEAMRLGTMEWLPRVTRATKQLAKAIAAPVLLLVQLNKDVETREDPRPRLTDLPYSGEQDADAVLAIHRPELYMANGPPPMPPSLGAEAKAQRLAAWNSQREAADGLVEVSFLKRRFGPTGWASLRFDKVPMLFREPVSEPAPLDLLNVPYAESEAAYA